MKPFAAALNRQGRGHYAVPAGPARTKVQVLSRLTAADFRQRHTNIHGDMTIWALKASFSPHVLVAVAHLPAKSGGCGCK